LRWDGNLNFDDCVVKFSSRTFFQLLVFFSHLSALTNDSRFWMFELYANASFAVKGFAVLILGGLGSLPGDILGGMVLGVSESLAAGFLSSAYKDVISFLIMILVLLVMPQGLMGKK
jgi:ABC-type branched-subunit amino acid transport system permease subunit